MGVALDTNILAYAEGVNGAARKTSVGRPWARKKRKEHPLLVCALRATRTREYSQKSTDPAKD